MLDLAKSEMTAYYRKMDMKGWMNFGDSETAEKFRTEYAMSLN